MERISNNTFDSLIESLFIIELVMTRFHKEENERDTQEIEKEFHLKWETNAYHRKKSSKKTRYSLRETRDGLEISLQFFIFLDFSFIYERIIEHRRICSRDEARSQSEYKLRKEKSPKSIHREIAP